MDRASGLPLHIQLHDELRADIESGRLEPGAKLPSELLLSERFGVNRLTVRQALAELARAGLVVPRQGVGTFVAPRPETVEIDIDTGDWVTKHERATEAAAIAGREVVEKLLGVEEVEAPRSVADHLGHGVMLWLETVHTLDREPVFRSQYWLRTAPAPAQVWERAEQGFGYQAIRDLIGQETVQAWRAFDAVAASRRDASVLKVPTGAPLLRHGGLNTDTAGRPLLYLLRASPSGRVRFVARPRPREDHR
ncbi:hypothetical protein AMK11_15605 [Streptomyces sp. CB02414]|nr:hypothetical protein AMK11_15605 [Streptomyces sp. CB02414]